MSTSQRNAYGILIWVIMSIGNGVFEERLWRGVYPILFPEDYFFGFIWPAIWFSIWHLAPGSLSINFSPFVLVSGALMLWSSVLVGVAFRTKSLFWATVWAFFVRANANILEYVLVGGYFF